MHYYEDNRVELYDLDADPGESNNVATENPKMAKLLREKLDRWRESVGANQPTLNENANGAAR